LEVAKSRVTKIVDGLIEKGLVRRFEDPEDARIKLISLTPAGYNKAEEIREFQKDIHRQILIHLGEDESEKVLSKLEMLRSAMELVKKHLN
jgi:DNA-binding MarR family transcriptional regulator